MSKARISIIWANDPRPRMSLSINVTEGGDELGKTANASANSSSSTVAKGKGKSDGMFSIFSSLSRSITSYLNRDDDDDLVRQTPRAVNEPLSPNSPRSPRGGEADKGDRQLLFDYSRKHRPYCLILINLGNDSASQIEPRKCVDSLIDYRLLGRS